MKDIPIEKTQKVGSKRDIDIKYLQGQLSGFFRNDPLTYCKTSPVKEAEEAPEASWLPESMTPVRDGYPTGDD